MYELFIGTIIQIIFLATCINFTLIFCQKKKPVEELMARPKFSEPAVAARPQEVPKVNNNEKPNIEHTISIKLDNNADDDDLQGPRESMSRDPMTEKNVPQIPKPVIPDPKYDPDVGARTPPSNLQWDPNKDANIKSSKPAASPGKDVSKKKRQKTVDLDATQECKMSKEEVQPSKKEIKPSKEPIGIKPSKEDAQKPLPLLSVKSLRSARLKRKTKSKPNAANNNNKSQRPCSVMSIKSQQVGPRHTPGGRTAESPVPKKNDGQTKETLERTQEDENNKPPTPK